MSKKAEDRENDKKKFKKRIVMDEVLAFT